MRKVLLQSAVTAALSMSMMTTVNAQEGSALDIGRLAIAGYGDVTYINQPNMKDAEGNDIQNNVAARFVPIFLFQMSEKIHIESELEFSTTEEGETETTLEYINMHYFLNDNTIITAGKFLLPFGQFGANLHPSWINKAASNPGIYGGHGGNGSLGGVTGVMGDTGINIANTWNLGDAGRIFTDFYTVSGPRQEEGHGGGVDMDVKKGDNNDTAAFGGRVAYAFLPEWEIGVSYYTGKYSNDGDLGYDAYTVDFNWIGSYASVRGEIFGSTAETEGEDAPVAVGEEGEEWVKDLDKNGWYIQGTWQARQLGKAWLNPVEFVLRYSDTSSDFDGSIAQDFDEDFGRTGSRVYYGVNYWLEPSTVLKLGAESTSLDDGDSDDRVFLQLAFGF